MGLRDRLRSIRWRIRSCIWTPIVVHVLARVLPPGFVYADELTISGRKAIRRTLAGVIGLVLGVLGVLLLGPDSWQEVLAGAVLAWSVSLIVWARTSYRRERTELEQALSRAAETDVLHARLNKICAVLGIPPLDLDSELQGAIDARKERLAHYAGLDEYRSGSHAQGCPEGFWDEVALGWTEK